MLVSVIMPAYNEEKLIGGSLEATGRALAVFAAKGWDWEIIVCDNNSTDKTRRVAEAAGATVVFEPVNQIGRARNRGAAIAGGQWLMFVDADSRPSTELFEEVAEEIAKGKCLAGGSTVRLDTDSVAARAGCGLWNWISRSLRLLAGSFIFCETSAFRQAGGFSEELFAGEELDLSRKLKRIARGRGKKVVILHRHPLVTSDRKVRLYGRGELLWFFVKAGIRWRKTLRSREACGPWYDGRR